MKIIAASLFAFLLSAPAALAWDDGYRSYHGEADAWRSYERGYHGEPYFFRGFYDRVADWPRQDFYDVSVDGYVPPSYGLYSENRGYGVEGRGWQLP